MRRTVCIACMLMLIIEACTPSPPQIPAATATTDLQPSNTLPTTLTPTFFTPPTIVQATQLMPPTDTPTPTEKATVESQPSEAQPPTPVPTLACEVDTATLVLSTSDEELQISDTVIVTAKVTNEGCVALGLPQYRLYIQSDRPEPILTLDNLEPIVHYLSVGPGQSDFVEFTLTAVNSGQATIRATVSYEVHLGYPGPAYWGSTGSGDPLLIIVEP